MQVESDDISWVETDSWMMLIPAWLWARFAILMSICLKPVWYV